MYLYTSKKKQLKNGFRMKKKLLIVFLIIIAIVFKISFYSEVKLNKIQTNNFQSVKERIIDRIENEEIVSLNDCDYEYSDEGDLILRNYIGTADSVRIPESIDGIKVKSVDNNIFSYDDELEVVRVPNIINNNIETIDGFEVNEELSNEEYVVYVSTKTYNSSYLKYIQLSEEEKEQYDAVPSKFEVSLEDYYQNINDSDFAKQYTNIRGVDSELPSTYDLRDHISVPVHNQLGGTCYACACSSTVETNIGLKLGKNEKMAELHLALVSGYGNGGHFVPDNHSYYNLGLGPISNSEWGTEEIIEKRTTDPICQTIYNYIKNDPYTESEYEQALTELKKSIPEYYVMKTVDLPSITKEEKDEYNKNKEEIEEKRNVTKQHIINNGAAYASINGYDFYAYENEGQVFVYNNSNTATNHGVAIIGWDDDFSSYDPTNSRPKSMGAWLCLNSGGNEQYGTELLWVSYADITVDGGLHGVVNVHQGKVNLNECDISLNKESVGYNGQEQRPSVTFKYDGYTYNNGIDYSVEYINNVNIGTATVRITGMNRFSGTIDKNFSIVDDFYTVEYSTKEMTNESVRVTITTKDPVETIDGWTRYMNRKVLTKTYTENATETVVIKNLEGEQRTATITIDNIDKTAPQLSVTYSPQGTTARSVTVTISSNEELKQPTGWSISGNKKVLTKEYEENITENVSVQDLAGNTTIQEIKIENITDIALGDLNENGEIDIGDLLMIYRHIAQNNSPETAQKYPDWKLSDEKISFGDLNNNGRIDIGDGLKIQRYIAAKNSPSVASKHPDWLIIN